MVYALQGLSFFVGFTGIIGIILNIVKREDARQDPLIDSHFRWQMQTFWWSLIWFVIAIAFWIFVIGIIIGAGAGVWYIYRVVRGAMMLSEGRPPKPNY
jgi:uncharacterized membrane protein